MTNDFLLAGNRQMLEWFAKCIKQQVVIGKVVIDGNIMFNGALIEQDKDGSIRLSMNSYLQSRKQSIEISPVRRKQQDATVTDEEMFRYQQLAGVLNFLGQGVLPQASFVASRMQQKLGRLLVKHLCDANGMVTELQQLKPEVYHTSPKGEVKRAYIASFSDASFNITSTQTYGQGGFISGIAFIDERSQSDKMYHVFDWKSSKQHRVCHSSYGAEIIACSDADDRGYAHKESINSFLEGICTPLSHHLYVDSNGLFDTITTLHESNDYRLRQTVQRIRDSFEAEDLDALIWIPGTRKIADALTGRNIKLYAELNEICYKGLLHDFDEYHILESKTWK